MEEEELNAELIMKLQLPDNSVSLNRGVKGFRVFEMEGML